ncbi:hypothetical protein HYU23_02920 [Candidatus Woesearchaeota archaeon]|nr:hypothetical protein [Candidatus Woesearchaeota archaeon]
MGLDEKLPIANWPAKSGEYKVVQLIMDGTPHLLFAEGGYETHSVIIMSLASKLRRNYPKIDFSDSTGTYQIPAQEAEWYKLVGAGKARIDVDGKKASLFGNSYNYRIGINPEHLDSVRPLIQDWKLE